MVFGKTQAGFATVNFMINTALKMSIAGIGHSLGPGIIFQPATLPCGRVVRNRLVKAAMYEHLATLFGGPPNSCHFRLYSEWAKHEWGIVLTGNVQVAPDHLTLGRDIVLPRGLSMPKDNDLEPFRRLADIIHGVGGKRTRDNQFQPESRTTLAILQLSHAGRQSANILGGRRILQRPMAPSSIRMGSSPTRNANIIEKLMNAVLFQKPKEMTEEDILHIIDRFVYGSVFAHKAGFDGVQLHVAHGYLLSQFVSPKANQRTDAYSCDKALDLIRSIVVRIRALTPKDFVISIKLSAADYTSGSPNASLTEHEQRALYHLLTIASWGTVDIIEVSGGDYETPSFMTSERSQCKSMKQSFFTRFSQQAIKALASVSNSSDPSTRPLILLTGGLRTAALLSKALALKHADLLGIGRAAVRSPDIPTILKSQLLEPQSDCAAHSDTPFQPEPEPNAIHLYPPASWLWKILLYMKLMGAGAEMAWHILVMRDLAMLPIMEEPTRLHMDYSLGALHCILMMFLWKLPTSNRQINGRIR